MSTSGCPSQQPDLETDDEDQVSIDGVPNFEVQDDVINDLMRKITIMTFPDDVIRVKKQTGQIMPLRNRDILLSQSRYMQPNRRYMNTAIALVRIAEINESQAMMEMVKNTYLANLKYISTDIERMHMDPES